MKDLSYDTLHNIRDMLNKQIHKEQLSTTLFNFKKDKLSQLKNDKLIIEKTIQKIYDVRYKENETE